MLSYLFNHGIGWKYYHLIINQSDTSHEDWECRNSCKLRKRTDILDTNVVDERVVTCDFKFNYKNIFIFSTILTKNVCVKAKISHFYNLKDLPFRTIWRGKADVWVDMFSNWDTLNNINELFLPSHMLFYWILMWKWRYFSCQNGFDSERKVFKYVIIIEYCFPQPGHRPASCSGC